MTRSRLEINIQRLLNCTETLSRDDCTSSNWRLERYVKALGDMLSELQKKSNKPDPEILNEYSRRVEFLKKLVESQKIESPDKRVVALQMMSHGVSTPDGNISREIQQKTASKYSLDIKKELLGNSKSEENTDGVRFRKAEKSSGEDLDSLIKYQQKVQEKVVNDILLLTRDLKEQTMLAGDIVKKDVEVLGKSAGLADQNLSKLKLEAARLEEHNKRAWKSWMWIQVFVVIVIFISNHKRRIKSRLEAFYMLGGHRKPSPGKAAATSVPMNNK